MASTRWSRRRARSAVRRDLTRFEVRLRSSCPGIGFTARITATVLTEPPYPGTTEEIARAVRTALRRAAGEVSTDCDPADLASARDVLGQHLARQRQLPTDPPVEFTAELTLDLLPDDRTAVATLLAAQRQQAVTDMVRRQKTDALAAELADPAALLVRWVEREGVDWSKLSDLADNVTRVAEVFAQHRPEDERTVEHGAVEVLREFLTSFPEHAQKRMLYALLAAGMDTTQRPQHAAKALALLNGHAVVDPEGES
ncbi:hypothetical protein QQY66_03485 [Streptomyces sp. DG2A-72]|uniref:hypothetical protein n=1 Tax=Streptomyces sp. DG2A-72 TaxID=3051386 RepID=UPI00265BD9FE|nr:hypothetical protein [Streptomyces sp. DG2A-72]MDO0930784.1 hypothetical protein [Streptomyces sp. DG2A-72]